MPKLFRPKAKKRGPAGPFFNVVPETAAAPAEIVMYGDIWETVPTSWVTGEPIDGMHVALDEMMQQLEAVKGASEIVIRLNSSGGDADVGINIYNQLSGFPGKKTVIVEGLAASAASIIMCAGDVVRLYPASAVLVHDVSAWLEGYYSTTDIETLLGDYRRCRKQMLAVYGAKTGKSDAELEGIIGASTWLVGQEVIDAGFADELIETAPPEEELEVSEDGESLMVAGVRHRMVNLGTIPDWVTGRNDEEPKDTQVSNPNPKEDDVSVTTVDELRAAYPDLAQKLVNEAVSKAIDNERHRLQEIESIQAGLDPTLVAKAKYTAPMSAGDLALEAMRADAAARAKMLNATDDDRRESGTDDVEPDPADEETDEEDRDRRETDRVVNAAIKMFNQSMGVEAR